MRRATFRWAPMKQPRRSANRIITLSLLFGAQLFSYMIRYALSVTAPTLMQVYHFVAAGDGVRSFRMDLGVHGGRAHFWGRLSIVSALGS